MKLENYKKAHFNDDDIKSNILNYTVLKIDCKGLLSFESFVEDFNVYLSQKGFIGEKELLSEEDLRVIDSIELFENYIELEPVVRFTKNNNTTRIIVTRFFTYLYLDYKTNHKLKDMIEIFNELVKFIKKKNDFVVFEKISLKKNNGVIVSSMSNILECFDTRLFNEPSFEINRIEKKVKTKLHVSKSKNVFTWEDVTFSVEKEIGKGRTKVITKENYVKDRDCYEIMLDIEGTIYFDVLEQKKGDYSFEVESKVEKINSGIFEIFKLHLSNSLLNDMTNGKTNKVLEGLNKNEEI